MDRINFLTLKQNIINISGSINLVTPESNFLSNFSTSKWSIVNSELLKTKYMLSMGWAGFGVYQCGSVE